MRTAQSFSRPSLFSDSNSQVFTNNQTAYVFNSYVYSGFLKISLIDLPSIGVPAADTSVSSVGEGPVAAQHQHVILCPEVALLRPEERLQARLSVRHHAPDL
jgi:hypothetical protein